MDWADAWGRLEKRRRTQYKKQGRILTRANVPGIVLLFFSRRAILQSLCRTALVLPLEGVLASVRSLWAQPASQSPEQSKSQTPLGVNFINVGREAGLNAKTIFGGEHKNKYLLETTGCGVAFYDYDNDGWLDIFLVNGTRLDEVPSAQQPMSHLFKNNRDGTFTDITSKA